MLGRRRDSRSVPLEVCCGERIRQFRHAMTMGEICRFGWDFGVDRMMKGNISSADHCPHCRHALEIVGVKFKLTGAAVISACPNCGIAIAENSNKRELKESWGATLARVQQDSTETH